MTGPPERLRAPWKKASRASNASRGDRTLTSTSGAENGDAPTTVPSSRSGVVADALDVDVLAAAFAQSLAQPPKQERAAHAAAADEHGDAYRVGFKGREDTPFEGRTGDGHATGLESSSTHRQPHAALFGHGHCLGVAGIGMTCHADPGIGGEHPLQPRVRIGGAVGDDDHAGVQRLADADAAAVMHRHPRRATRRVEQRIQDRPVGDGVAAVAHGLRLAVRRGDGSGIEMIAADDHGCADLAASHHVVDLQSESRAGAVAKPADARRQPLELHAGAGQPDPPRQRLVVGKQLEDGAIGGRDVVRIAGQRRPPERALAFAEQRPDVLGHEAGNVERIGDAGVNGLRPDVVAVIEDDTAATL